MYNKIMDSRFLAHNLHVLYPDDYALHDPQLRKISNMAVIHEPELIREIPISEPGIYTIGGGRQVGKTSALKLLIAHLLKLKINPKNIMFFSGELIDDHHSFLQILNLALAEKKLDQIYYVFVDEVSYIKDWDKTIKYAYDSGLFDQVVVILTGSDLVLIEEARMRFPGRRGKADKVDFHLYPLSFGQYLKLANPNLFANIFGQIDIAPEHMQSLYEFFYNYTIHGGYLTAINDYVVNKKINLSNFMTYSDWIRGDIIKRDKKEYFLRELLSAIILSMGGQVSWNSLAQHLSINHPNTVADYASLLASMDVIFIQHALKEDTLSAAPKKAKKISFCDPFIFHAVRSFLEVDLDPYNNQVLPALANPKINSALIEGIVVNHYKRHYPTYYIKGEGEVDIAYVNNKKFSPVEVKWRNNNSSIKDLKQLVKYKNPLLLSKTLKQKDHKNYLEIPLPVALLNL